MLAVQCPQVRSGRGQRLVSERRIVAMAGSPEGFVLTVRCPCGQQHLVRTGRAPALTR